VPASGTCTVNYQVCAPAPNATQCDTATLTVNGLAPDLAMTKTSTSTFTVGSTASFTLTPNNLLGAAPTVGTVTVTDTLPTGLVYVPAGSGGAGWTCTAAGQVVTCTSAAVIPAGGTGTPITINVSIVSTAVPSVTNVASVSVPNEPPANTGNNSAILTVPVGNAAVNTFLTDGAQTGTPGSTVFYPHTFNAGSTGTVSFATTQAPNPNIPGWTTTILRDTNCNGTLDGTEGAAPLTGSTAVNAGDQVCIIVRNDIPAGAPFNAQDVITTTATFTPPVGPSINYTRQDVTTVVLSGGLTLAKTVRNVTQGTAAGTANAAKPGDVLEYVITYSNTANAPVSTIVITDVTPVFTTFVSAACTTPLPAAITACTLTSTPAAGSSGTVTWTLGGALNAGQSGTVLFRVTVQ
jgi:mucin-19